MEIVLISRTVRRFPVRWGIRVIVGTILEGVPEYYGPRNRHSIWMSFSVTPCIFIPCLLLLPLLYVASG